MARGKKSKKTMAKSRKYGMKMPVHHIIHLGNWRQKVDKWRREHPNTRVVC